MQLCKVSDEFYWHCFDKEIAGLNSAMRVSN